MKHSQDSLAQALVSRGMLRADAAPMPLLEPERPWYIAAVLGFAGWFAGLYVLGFLTMWLKPDDSGSITVLAALLLAAAFMLYRFERDNPFIGQLALGVSIAGQFAAMWASHEITASVTQTAAITAGLQLSLAVIMPNRFAKVLSAFFACTAWVLFVRLLWFGERAREQMAVDPAAALACWAMAWLPVVGTAYWLVTHEQHWVATSLRSIARPALSGVLATLCMVGWLSEPFAALQFSSARTAANWLVIWPLLAVLTALLAAYFAFRVRHRALIGLAIFGALLHVGHFYYLLGTTLLVKSCLMLLLGVTLLIVAHVLRRREMP